MLLAVPWRASPQILGTGNVASETTQILNMGLLADQLRNAEQQLRSLTTALGRSEYRWTDVSRDVSEVFRIARDLDAVRRGAVAQEGQFAARHPDYEAWQRAQRPEDLRTLYQRWTDTSALQIDAILRAANLQASQFRDEQQTQEALRTLSATKTAQAQAAQVGHQLSLELLADHQKLRQLVMLQIELQAGFQRDQRAREASEQAGAEKLLRARPPVIGDDRGWSPSDIARAGSR